MLRNIQKKVTRRNKEPSLSAPAGCFSSCLSANTTHFLYHHLPLLRLSNVSSHSNKTSLLPCSHLEHRRRHWQRRLPLQPEGCHGHRRHHRGRARRQQARRHRSRPGSGPRGRPSGRRLDGVARLLPARHLLRLSCQLPRASPSICREPSNLAIFTLRRRFGKHTTLPCTLTHHHTHTNRSYSIPFRLLFSDD